MLNLLSSGCEVAISSVEEDLLTNFFMAIDNGLAPAGSQAFL